MLTGFLPRHVIPRNLLPSYVVPELRRRANAPVGTALEDLSNLLDAVVPVVVEQIVSRIDLTAIVLRHVDIDAIVATVDPAGVIARVEVVDVVGLTEQVINAVDLPEIIRESTGAMASETVQSARMQGIAADDALARAVDRLRPRRSRAAWATRVSRSTMDAATATPTAIPDPPPIPSED